MGNVAIVEPTERWREEFRLVAADLAAALGGLEARIDHIGSTAVPGLAAKDVIDVQVSVRDWRSLELSLRALAGHGYVVRDDARDHAVPGESADARSWRKGFATERPGERRTNVHVRLEGAPNQRYALLVRDYLRAHPGTASAYAAFKRRAAGLLPQDSATYADLKDPVCDLIYLPANVWAQSTGWRAAPG